MGRRKVTELTENEARVILAMASHQLSPMKAAKVLHYGRNSIYHKCRRITEKTGKNPQDFYDMCVLLPMAHDRLGHCDEQAEPEVTYE